MQKPEIISAIQKLGEKYRMEEIVLFVSRARKTNGEGVLTILLP